MKKIKLTPLEIDALEEVTSIGFGNASAVLCNLTGTEIDISTPEVNIIPIKQISKLIAGPSELVLVIHSKVTGDFFGNIMVVLPRKSSFLLVDMVMKKKKGTTKNLTKKESRILEKVSLAITKSYVDALKSFLGLKIKQSKPKITSTFGEMITDFVFFCSKEKTEHGIMLDTKFAVQQIKAEFTLLLTLKSANRIINAVKKKVGEAG